MKKQPKRQLVRNVFQILFLIFSVVGLFLRFNQIMFILMFIMVMGGAFHCSWVCPYGTLQEFAGKIGKLLGIKKRKLPKSIHKYLKYIRYINIILFGLMTPGIISQFFALDPRSNFSAIILGNTASILALICIVFFIALSMVYERFYCNYFCYIGAKWGVMALARPFTIIRNNEKCVNCKKCDSVCPMNIEISKTNTMRSPSCINCFRCIDACPVDDALTYRLIKLNKKMAIVHVVLVFLVGLGVIFGLYFKSTGSKISENVNALSISIDDMGTDDTIITSKNIPGSSSLSKYKDGIYTGSGKGLKSTISVKVTIENGIISDIVFTEQDDVGKMFKLAYKDIVSSIFETQSADVDTVSGATYSSSGIRDAVAEALEKAK